MVTDARPDLPLPAPDGPVIPAAPTTRTET